MQKPDGYSRLQISLHWVIALLVVLQFVFHDGAADAWGIFVKGGEFQFSRAVIAHIAFGDAIFLLVVWRLFVRLRRGVPAAPEGESALQVLIAKAVHILLYVVLLLMPISGAVAAFGQVEAVGGAHELMKGVLLALVGLHFLGALVNQYVQKNGLIRRMMKAG